MRNEKGFTLIEILIVIAIIGLLFVFLAPNLNSVNKNSGVNNVETDFRTMKIGVEQFFLDNRDEVFTEKSLKDYVSIGFKKVSADGDALLDFESIHKTDPWGNPYHIYVNNDGDRYVMFHSYGPDEKESIVGSSFGDDIVYIFYPKL